MESEKKVIWILFPPLFVVTLCKISLCFALFIRKNETYGFIFIKCFRIQENKNAFYDESQHGACHVTVTEKDLGTKSKT